MKTEQLIAITTFCNSHQIEPSFIQTLANYELVNIITENETEYIEETRLTDVERIVRLHYDLNINVEGIDAIQHLLQQIDSLQKEVLSLKNKLHG